MGHIMHQAAQCVHMRLRNRKNITTKMVQSKMKRDCIFLPAPNVVRKEVPMKPDIGMGIVIFVTNKGDMMTKKKILLREY